MNASVEHESQEHRYRTAGMGELLGFGDSPAVGVIDLQVGYTDETRSSLASNLDGAIAGTNRILEAARAARIPVFFTVEAWDPQTLATTAALMLKKVPTIEQLAVGSELVTLDRRIQREAGEPLVVKNFASAFFATSLAGMLTSMRVDTVILAGCTTSGCIRATAMDALNHGFRPIVAADAVGDRSTAPHDAALFDISMKYGDVVSVNDVVDYLHSRCAVQPPT